MVTPPNKFMCMSLEGKGPTEPTNRRARQARAIEKRKAILDSAIELMFAQGLQGVTHRQVAARASVPVGSIGYYFNTRDELLIHALGVLGEANDVEAAALAADMPEPSADAADQKLPAEEAAKILLDIYLPRNHDRLVGWVGVKMDCVRESVALQETLQRQRSLVLVHLAEALRKAGYEWLRAELVVLVIEGAVVEAAVAGETPVDKSALEALGLLLSAA